MKDLSDDHVVQIFIVGLSNKYVWYALIHENVSIIRELVAHAYKFADADEMRDHHLTKAHQAKPWQGKPRKQEPSRLSRP